MHSAFDMWMIQMLVLGLNFAHTSDLITISCRTGCAEHQAPGLAGLQLFSSGHAIHFYALMWHCIGTHLKDKNRSALGKTSHVSNWSTCVFRWGIQSSFSVLVWCKCAAKLSVVIHWLVQKYNFQTVGVLGSGEGNHIPEVKVQTQGV